MNTPRSTTDNASPSGLLQPEPAAATSQPRHVLVIGATGVAGSAFLSMAGRTRDWQLSGVSRQAAQHDSTPAEWQLVTADLLDAASTRRSALARLEGVTDVVFAGFAPAPTFAQQVEPNLALLANCLQVLPAEQLQRVVLIQGMKYYGSHLGAFKTPAREEDSRHHGANYYYAQQDLLEAGAVDWTCLRPHVICGTHSVGTPQNIMTVIGCYASLMPAGEPLTWPGTADSFQSINQATDADLLASAIIWAIESPAAANQAFNVTNGDFFRWQHLWPRIATLFNRPAGGVDTRDLQTLMPPLAQQWSELAARQGLHETDLSRLAHWNFADYILRTGWDVMASTVKIRQAGFAACLDTEDMYLRHLQALIKCRVLPDCHH